MTLFSPLGMGSERNAQKNGEPSLDFSFTTMLYHTGWFWWRMSYRRTIWKHWSFPHPLLIWLKLAFTSFLDWNQHCRYGAGICVILLTLLNMRLKSCKGFLNTASRNVSNTFTVAGRRTPFWRKYSFNDCIFCILRNKLISVTFLSYHVHAWNLLKVRN